MVSFKTIPAEHLVHKISQQNGGGNKVSAFISNHFVDIKLTVSQQINQTNSIQLSTCMLCPLLSTKSLEI